MHCSIKVLFDHIVSAGEQQRWAYLFSAELISKQEAEAWAEQVWPSDRSEAS